MPGMATVTSCWGEGLCCHAVDQEHACIEAKSGRLYLSALVGDPDNFRDATRTWLNDSELRPGMTKVRSYATR